MMFQMCADGYGSRTIAKTLTDKGIFSRSNQPFNDSTVRRIIRNPLFKGTHIMNKAHFDFNTKTKTRNKEEDWIWKEDAVPPIVEEALWEKANVEMDRKTRINHSAENMKQKRGIKVGNHPLSGKIICGECGGVFWRTRYKRASGEQVINWCCCEYVRNGRRTPDPHRTPKSIKVRAKNRGCDNVHLNHQSLEEVLLEVANAVFTHKEELMMQAVDILTAVFRDEDDSKVEALEVELQQIGDKRSKLLDKYLEDAIAEGIYRKKDAELAEKMNQIELAIQKEERKRREYRNIDERIQILQEEMRRIIDSEVALHFVYEHITSIQVLEKEFWIQYDMLPATRVEITKINYHKRVFSVCVLR